MNHRMHKLALAFVLVAGATPWPARADSSAPTGDAAIPLATAVGGIKGKGPLVAKIEIGGGVTGTFTCELFEAKAPLTVANFVGLARGLRAWKDSSGAWVKKPLYDGVIFHRVIPDFMIQGGDPDGTGRGGPGYEFADETTNGLGFDKSGLLAMANKGPNTNGSQFFITEGTPAHLNGHHTVFGACEPLDLVKKVTHVKRLPGDRPETPIAIKKITFQRGKK